MAFYFSQKSIYDILFGTICYINDFLHTTCFTYKLTVLSPKEEEFNDSNSHFVDASLSVKQQNPAGTY